MADKQAGRPGPPWVQLANSVTRTTLLGHSAEQLLTQCPWLQESRVCPAWLYRCGCLWTAH